LLSHALSLSSALWYSAELIFSFNAKDLRTLPVTVCRGTMTDPGVIRQDVKGGVPVCHNGESE